MVWQAPDGQQEGHVRFCQADRRIPAEALEDLARPHLLDVGLVGPAGKRNHHRRRVRIGVAARVPGASQTGTAPPEVRFPHLGRGERLLFADLEVAASFGHAAVEGTLTGTRNTAITGMAAVEGVLMLTGITGIAVVESALTGMTTLFNGGRLHATEYPWRARCSVLPFRRPVGKIGVGLGLEPVGQFEPNVHAAELCLVKVVVAFLTQAGVRVGATRWQDIAGHVEESDKAQDQQVARVAQDVHSRTHYHSGEDYCDSVLA
mmetsp:Transcript_103781/g.320091  ORF Transcript_103781/g.320091 Transcript_103781/m.320091 type:complete len:262 (-) Transcript_103781:613-1398(-)